MQEVGRALGHVGFWMCAVGAIFLFVVGCFVIGENVWVGVFFCVFSFAMLAVGFGMREGISRFAQEAQKKDDPPR